MRRTATTRLTRASRKPRVCRRWGKHERPISTRRPPPRPSLSRCSLLAASYPDSSPCHCSSLHRTSPLSHCSFMCSPCFPPSNVNVIAVTHAYCPHDLDGALIMSYLHRCPLPSSLCSCLRPRFTHALHLFKHNLYGLQACISFIPHAGLSLFISCPLPSTSLVHA